MRLMRIGPPSPALKRPWPIFASFARMSCCGNPTGICFRIAGTCYLLSWSENSAAHRDRQDAERDARLAAYEREDA